MSTMSIRLPDSLHRKLRDFARQDDISINWFVTTAVAKKLATFATLEYLEARAKCITGARFAAALAQVPDVETDEQNRYQLAEADANFPDHHARADEVFGLLVRTIRYKATRYEVCCPDYQGRNCILISCRNSWWRSP